MKQAINWLTALIFFTLFWLMSGFFLLKPSQSALLTFVGKSISNQAWELEPWGALSHQTRLFWYWPAPVGRKMIYDHQKIRSIELELGTSNAVNQLISSDKQILKSRISIEYQISRPALFFKYFSPVHEFETGETVLSSRLEPIIISWVGQQPAAELQNFQKQTNDHLLTLAKKIITRDQFGISITSIRADFTPSLDETLVQKLQKQDEKIKDDLSAMQAARNQQLKSINESPEKFIAQAQAELQAKLQKSKELHQLFETLLPQFEKDPLSVQNRLFSQMVASLVKDAKSIQVDQNRPSIALVTNNPSTYQVTSNSEGAPLDKSIDQTVSSLDDIDDPEILLKSPYD